MLRRPSILFGLVVCWLLLLVAPASAAWRGTFKLNNGAAYTRSRSVIGYSSVRGALVMRFRTGSTYGRWRRYARTVRLTLPAGDGRKRVYAQYRNRYKRILTLSDTIILDTRPPSGSFVINDDDEVAGDRLVTLTSSVSGAYQMRIRTGTTYGAWLGYAVTRAASLPVGDGLKTVYVQYRDRAGNILACSDTIELDDTGPAITLDAGNGTAICGLSKTVCAQVTDAHGVDAVELSYRDLGETDFQTLTMTDSGTSYEGVIDDVDVGDLDIQYFVTAEDEFGNTSRCPVSGTALIVTAGGGSGGGTHVGGTLTGTTSWTKENNPYIIDSDVIVPNGATLNIGPGTIVKSTGAGAGLIVEGTLNAVGTALEPICFTSLKDDVWGDTNGDGSLTSPAAGDWSSWSDAGIYFETGGAGSLRYAIVRHSTTGVRLSTTGAVTIGNDTINDNSVHAVHVEGGAPILSANTIRNNQGYGLCFSSPGFAKNLQSGQILATNGHANAIYVGSGTVGENQTLLNHGVPYVVDGEFRVAQLKTLTVNPGVVMKFADRYSGIHVEGILGANGTATERIYFTSLRDDSVGGDTNEDGSATTPDRGDWGSVDRGIFFHVNSSGSVTYATLRYSVNGFVGWSTVAATVSNNVIAENSGHAIETDEWAPTMANNQITNNGGYCYHFDSIMDARNLGSGHTLSGNGHANAIYIGGGTVTTNRVLADLGVPYVFEGETYVDAGRTLTISSGVIAKFADRYSGLLVDGILSSNGTTTQPIYLTSLRDDAVGGDTNEDASATTPDAGDWGSGDNGVYFRYNSSGSVSHTVVRYSVKAVSLYSALSSTNIRQNVIAHNSSRGIEVDGCAPTISANEIVDNGDYGLWFCQIIDARNLLGDQTLSGNGHANAIYLAYYGNVSSSMVLRNHGVPYVVETQVFIPEGKTLTIEPGVMAKFARRDSGIIVDGTLNANGTAGQLIRLTSINDDAVGGDTNEDGATTSPAPLDWFTTVSSDVKCAIAFRYHSGGTLSNVIIDYSATPPIWIDPDAYVNVTNIRSLGPALQALKDFEDSTTSGVWTQIAKPDLIADMRLAIESPLEVSNGQQNLCGPAAIVYELVKRNPERYVALMRQLYEQGYFNAGTIDITPASQLYSIAVPSGITCADWMIMASMRDDENTLFDYDPGDDVAGISWPSDMVLWAEQILQFSNVNYTSTYTFGEADAIVAANNAYNANGCAFLLIDCWMLQSPEPLVCIPEHWVPYAGGLQVSTDRFVFDTVSWGEVKHVDVNESRFEDCMWGVVTATT